MVKISSKSVNKQPNYRYPKKILKFGKTNEKQSFFQACKLKMTKETHFSQAVFGHFEKILKPGNKKSQNKLSKSFKTQEFSIQNSFFLLKVLNLIDLAEKLAQTEAKLNLMSKFKEFFLLASSIDLVHNLFCFLKSPMLFLFSFVDSRNTCVLGS